MQKQIFNFSYLFAAINFICLLTGILLLLFYEATGETITELKRLGLGLVFFPLFVFGIFQNFTTVSVKTKTAG